MLQIKMIGGMGTQSPEPIARRWLYSDDLMSCFGEEPCAICAGKIRQV
jgi:hypothetical protein